jgi:DNA-binding transcriptional ArsR family regulator
VAVGATVMSDTLSLVVFMVATKRRRIAAMVSTTALAETAALVGDPARANVLSALMDGRALTAAELARAASVAPQTASGHLARLTTAGLLAVEKQGRHRYHRLASPEVARMLEGIMAVAEIGPERARRPVSVGPRDLAMRTARTCYDHLAGKLAVAMADAMVEWGHMELSPDGGALTPDGAVFLRSLGVDLGAAEARAARRGGTPVITSAGNVSIAPSMAKYRSRVASGSAAREVSISVGEDTRSGTIIASSAPHIPPTDRSTRAKRSTPRWSNNPRCWRARSRMFVVPAGKGQIRHDPKAPEQSRGNASRAPRSEGATSLCPISNVSREPPVRPPRTQKRSVSSPRPRSVLKDREACRYVSCMPSRWERES